MADTNSLGQLVGGRQSPPAWENHGAHAAPHARGGDDPRQGGGVARVDRMPLRWAAPGDETEEAVNQGSSSDVD